MEPLAQCNLAAVYLRLMPPQLWGKHWHLGITHSFQIHCIVFSQSLPQLWTCSKLSVWLNSTGLVWTGCQSGLKVEFDRLFSFRSRLELDNPKCFSPLMVLIRIFSQIYYQILFSKSCTTVSLIQNCKTNSNSIALF